VSCGFSLALNCEVRKTPREADRNGLDAWDLELVPTPYVGDSAGTNERSDSLPIDAIMAAALA